MDNTKGNSVDNSEISPQRENGHLDIANELVEALAKTQLSGYESRVIWGLWRKTWCWIAKDKQGKKISIKNEKGKRQFLKLKSAVISSKAWVELTGLNKYNISRTLRELVLRNIVIKNDNKNEWSFQKYYDKWLLPIKKIVIKNDNTYFVTKNDNAFIKNDNGISKIDNEMFRKVFSGKALLTLKDTLKDTCVKIEEKDHTIKGNSLREEEEIFSYWNTIEINPNKDINPYIQDIKEALKDYPVKEIKTAISNYAHILTSEFYKFDYHYYLDSFLKAKTIVKFIDLEKAKDHYKDYAFKNEDEGDFVQEYYHSDKEQDKRTREEIQAERDKVAKLAGIQAKKLKGK